MNVNLIPRAVGYNWMLAFSTELHGFSLNTIYRNLAQVDGPCLVVVMDTNRNVIGHFLIIFCLYIIAKYLLTFEDFWSYDIF